MREGVPRISSKLAYEKKAIHVPIKTYKISIKYDWAP